MAIIVNTEDPNELLNKIKSNINRNHIDTWTYDEDGDFTHSPSQFVNKAWFKPYILSGILHFGLLGPSGIAMTKSLYGIYHGRFIEMLLSHFDDDFLNVYSTAQKHTKVDHFKTVK